MNDPEFTQLYINKLLQRVVELEVKNIELEAKVERSGQLLQQARDMLNAAKEEKSLCKDAKIPDKTDVDGTGVGHA